MILAPVLLVASLLAPTVVDEFRLERIDELNSDTSTPTSFDHCLRFTFGATMTPITSSGGSSYIRCVWVKGTHSNYATKIYAPYPDTTTPGHTNMACYFKPTEYESDTVTGGWRHRHVTGTPPSGEALGVHVFYAPGGNVATEAGQFLIQYSEQRVPAGSGGSSNTYKWHRWTYDVTKHLCTDTSVDSRIANGKENIDYFGNTGSPDDLHEDPNAYPANLNFGTSVYKGGLFAGNINWGSGDFSGRAHIQLWGTAAGSNDFLASATLVHMLPPKSPYGANASLDLGVHTYGSSDSATETTGTWANRWLATDPDTQANVAAPFYVNFGSGTVSKSYANWPLNKYDTSTDSYTTLNTHRVVIAPNNLNQEAVKWRYFASREFQSSQSWTTSDFPFNDCRPRLWILGQSAYSTGP